MNVAYILSSATGGGFKSFINMLEELIKKGVYPIVILPEKNEILEQLSNMDVPTIVVKYRYNTYPPFTALKDKLLFPLRLIARQIINYYAIIKITRLLSNKNISIIHTNVSVIGIGHHIAKRLQIPHVFHVREYGDLDFHYKYFPTKKNFVKQLTNDYSIFITKDIQKHFQQEANVKSVVIYNGIQKEANKIPNQPNNKYFLYLGDILPAKGTDVLVKAYAEYIKKSNKRLDLYIAGRVASSSYADDIHKYIKKHELEKHILFLEKQKDVKHLLQDACAIIIPSVKEGFGRCMPEAMFRGCLAIAHNTGGSKEQLDNARTITGQDVALQYENLSELPFLLLQAEKMTKQERESYTVPAFQVVNKLYTNEKCGNSVFAFYKNILETHHKS